MLWLLIDGVALASFGAASPASGSITIWHGLHAKLSI